MIVMDEFPNDFFSGPLETPEDLNGPNKEFSREFRVRNFFGILNIIKPIFKYFGYLKDDYLIEDQCTLSMKHRHDSNLFENPDCNADMTELKICVIMSFIR